MYRQDLYHNFELTNHFNGVISKIRRKYGEDALDKSLEQVLSLIGYKYLSQNPTGVADRGYTLKEEYHYNNLSIHKKDVKEILMKGIKEITQENDNQQAADVFYDLFDLVDFETYPNNEDWLFFIEMVEWVMNNTKASLGQAFNFITQYPKKTRININNLRPYELLAKIITKNQEKVENLYDPYATNGSLMASISNLIDVNHYYGQHDDFNKYVLAKLNLLVNNVNYKNIHIKNEDIVNQEDWGEIKFDLSATIPPFNRFILDISPDDERFQHVKPYKTSDLPYILDMLYNLDDDGTMAVIVPQATLFKKGAHHKIIKYLVDNQLIKSIIALPAILFEDRSIPTALIIFDKKPKNDIFFMNLENAWFKKEFEDPLNLFKADTYIKMLIDKEDVDLISKSVDLDEIRDNDYNLSINRYIEFEVLKKIDIDEKMANITEIEEKLKQLDDELNSKIKNLLNL